MVTMGGDMLILAHRGLWSHRSERNTLASLHRALDMGFGIETDVRDMRGQLVLSHDMPAADHNVLLEDLLAYYASNGCSTVLALNIKADGLHEALHALLLRYRVSNYFVFDMSIPDTLGYLARSMPTFMRRSEFEVSTDLEQRAAGVWVDELSRTWLTADTLRDLARNVPAMSIVSAEIHGRAHMAQWREIRQAQESIAATTQLMFCTDLPDHARNYFL
jgi:glycerophosphoryl diester phosphodiesterase